jgi:hypothetical protein
MRRAKQQTTDAKIKSEFRKSLKWKRWRYAMIDYYGNKDALTLKPLHKFSNTHHMDMRAENYTKLSPERFRMLNSKSHELIHFFYPYFVKDPFIIDRLKAILEEMVKMNND